MTAFAAMTVFAADEHSVDDNSAADPRPKRKEHQTPEVFTAANPELTVGRGVRIILKCDRFLNHVSQFVTNWKIPPRAKIVRLQQHPCGDVHRPRRCQPDVHDRVHIQTSIRNQLVAHFTHPATGVFGSRLLMSGHAGAGNRATVIVNDAKLDARSADIDPEKERSPSLCLYEMSSVRSDMVALGCFP